jgi:hypothetical protein
MSGQQLKEQESKFVVQVTRISQAFVTLSNEIERLEHQFAPVINNVPTCAATDKANKTPSSSGFDTFIDETENTIVGFAGRLNSISERSAV